jgi:hypothetical protein
LSEKNSNLLLIKYERVLHHLRTNTLTEEIISTLPPSVHTQRITIMFLYKKQNMASMRQCLTKLRDLRDEWGAFWKCKVCMTMGSSDFDRYYDEFQPKTYEWTIRKLLLGIKRALQMNSFSRAGDLLHTLKSKLAAWSVFLEPEIVRLKDKFYTKYYRLKAKSLFKINPNRASRIFWNKIHDKKQDIELELQVAFYRLVLLIL